MGTMRRRAWRSAQNERQRVRCADAPTRQHGTRRIKFARALASQRPPSRERPPLGGGGAGRALFPSLCPSPRSRSIDETEHRLRQVRGPPACSSAGTLLSAAAAAAAAALCKESHFPAFPAAGRWPRGAVGPGAGHDGVTGPRGARRRRPFGGAASVEDAAGRAAPCSHAHARASPGTVRDTPENRF